MQILRAALATLATVIAVIALASTPAFASPAADNLPDSPSELDADLARQTRTRVFDFDDVVIGDVNVEFALGLEPGDLELLRSPPTNPRIIDIDLMHRRDCALDRVHGGQCVLRGFDEPAEPGIDVEAYGHARAQRSRIEVLDRILDSADVAP